MGQDRHPDWLLNLRADPRARILLPGRALEVDADGLARGARPPLARRGAHHPADEHLRAAHDAGHPRRPAGRAVTPGAAATPAAPGVLDRDSTRGRLMLAGVTLGSGVAILDGSVVNVALRTIGRDLGASLAQLQWVVNGYLLALASLVLVGGALGDRFGRRRVYLVGVVWFLVASALCAAAQTPPSPHRPARVPGRRGRAAHARRAVADPGVVPPPGPRPGDRHLGRAVGCGGGARAGARRVAGRHRLVAVDLRDQRAAVRRGRRAHRYAAPESRDPTVTGRFDVLGAALTVVALGAATYALTASTEAGLSVVVGAWGGVGAARWRSWSSRGARHPHWFRPGCSVRASSPRPTVMTLLVYGALGGVSLFTVLQLQAVGWSALQAGLSGHADHPAPCCCSRRGPRRCRRGIGPRIPMTVGPLVCAAGALLLLGVGEGATWWSVLPG